MTELAQRVVPGEIAGWVDEPAPRSPWAAQERVCHAHPLAREDYDQPLLIETIADLATWWPSVRWLVIAGQVGALLALSAPTWVWWTLAPTAVAWVVDWRLPRRG